MEKNEFNIEILQDIKNELIELSSLMRSIEKKNDEFGLTYIEYEYYKHIKKEYEDAERFVDKIDLYIHENDTETITTVVKQCYKRKSRTGLKGRKL